MSVIKMGKTTGKLNIAIKVAELFALPAIAEIKVKVIEKPTWRRQRKNLPLVSNCSDA